MNPLDNIISQLEQQRAAIDNAIAALSRITDTGATPARKGRKPRGATALPTAPKKKRKMSAEGRKAIGDAARRRWAAVKAAKGGK